MTRISWHGSALVQGALAGLLIVVPVSVLTAVLEHLVDDLDGSLWLFLPFLVLLFGYLAAGYGAGRLAPDAPLSHGMVAALATFAAWIVLRTLVPLALGWDLGFTPRQVVVNALFAAALGVFGGTFAARTAHLVRERENGGGGEPAGWPRHDADRAEERPDSTGQGAG